MLGSGQSGVDLVPVRREISRRTRYFVPLLKLFIFDIWARLLRCDSDGQAGTVHAHNAKYLKHLGNTLRHNGGQRRKI